MKSVFQSVRCSSRGIFLSLFALAPSAWGVSTTLIGTGNWTVPTGVTSVTVEMWGGGGGGGAESSTTAVGSGSGGGGGGYSRATIATTPGASIAYSVGAGGTAGTILGGAPTAGGNTTFTGVSDANGGGAGNNSTVAGVAGGTAGTGATASGGAGQSGSQSSQTGGAAGGGAGGWTGSAGQNGAAGGSVTTSVGGIGGGTAPSKGGDGASATVNATAGSVGGAPGGGGSGGKATAGGTRDGGAGGAGTIILTYTLALPSEPTIQASNVTFSSAQFDSYTINWTNGNGSGRIVLVKAGSAVDAAPADGNTYTANTVFGSGQQLGTGNYVVYSGSGNSVTLSGLTRATIYHVAVYELNGTAGLENYLSTSPATGNAAARGTTYYSVAGGDPSVLASWNTNPDGISGTAPTEFSPTGDVFEIQSGHTMTATGAWTVFGPGPAKIHINSGAKLDMAGFKLNIGGDFINDGIFASAGSDAVTFRSISGTESAVNPPYTFKPGVSTVGVLVQGGGGGGGGASAAGTGGGGGGGASAYSASVSVNPTTSYTVTVGNGGAKGAAGASAVAGANGASSQISGGSITTITANGGAGGTNTTSTVIGAGGLGGAAGTSGATANFAGGAGAVGYGGGGADSAGAGNAATTSAAGAAGSGTITPGGDGGAVGDATSVGAGYSGNPPGGGGGGGNNTVASVTGGNGASGRVTVVYPATAAPTVIATSATAIDSTTASLGVDVLSNGGADLTERGTVWDTSASPTLNSLAEGGTTTGAFTQSRTGLPAGTQIYYRGYATNSVGTGYSADATFYTLSTEPTTASSTMTFTSVGSNAMTVNWTSGNGARRIVVAKQGSAPTGTPADATAYTANAAYGSGAALGDGYVVYDGTGNSVAVTGLGAGFTYYYVVYEYNEAGSTVATINYRTSTSLSGNRATNAGLPTVSSPTATSITTTSATLGATVDSNGGAALTARGTVWGTSANPTGNALAQGGTTTGTFTHSRTGLTAGTLYYYRGYATNSAGTAYSADGTFYTLSTEPTTSAVAFAATPASTTSINLTWTAATGANGYLILQASGGTAPTGTPSDATGYSVGNTIGDGTVAAIATGTGTTITGLTAGTQYSFTIVPFNWNTVNAETSNYKTTSISSATSYTQYTYKYRSVASGNWNATGTWEVSTNNGVSYAAASTTPTSADDTVLIQTGHTVTVTASVTADQVTVQTGAGLTVASSQTLTIADGTGTDLDVTGTLTVNGTLDNNGGLALQTGSTGTVASGGVLKNTGAATITGTPTASATTTLTVNGTYQHNQNAGAVPFATWASTSTCEVVGIVATAPTFANWTQSFGNITWNCPSQTGTLGFGGFLPTVNGNLTVINTGSGNLRFGGNTFNFNPTINGNLIIQGGTLDLSSGSPPAGSNVTLNGNYNQSGGVLTVTGAVANGFEFKFNGASSTFTQSGGTFTADKFNFVVATGANLTLNNGFTSTGTLTVDSGATLNFNSKTVSVAATSLAGSLSMPVTRTGANTFTGSQLTQTAGTLTYGGTLTSSLVSGGPIVGGESIPLFVSGSFAGGFTSVTAPASSGVTANTTQLTGGTGGSITYDASGAPEIAVEQPVSTDIASGGSQGFGTVTVGSNTSLTFTIRNSGAADLNLTGIPLVAVSGTNASDFTVTAVPTSPVAAAGTTTFTVQFAPGASGARSAVLTIANNDSDEGTFTINVSGTGQTPYEAWASGGAFDADANGDGVKNGMAFLLGATSPTAAVTRPTVTQTTGNLVITFNMLKAANRGDAKLYVEHSSNLGISDAWTAVLATDSNSGPTSGVTFVVTPGGGTTNSIQATIGSAEGASGKLFGRLKSASN